MYEPKLNIIKGDATKPIGDGKKIIAHIVNNLGIWGAGFVIALSNRYPFLDVTYKKYVDMGGDVLTSNNNLMGHVQYVEVDDDITIANMFAQRGLRSKHNPKPVCYTSLETTLENLYGFAKENNHTVHMPKIGSGLGGGDWNTILEIIKKHMLVDTTIYYL